MEPIHVCHDWVVCIVIKFTYVMIKSTCVLIKSILIMIDSTLYPRVSWLSQYVAWLMLILTLVVSIMMHMDSMMAHMDMIVKSMWVVIETTYAMFESKIGSTCVMIKCTLWFDNVEEWHLCLFVHSYVACEPYLILSIFCQQVWTSTPAWSWSTTSAVR